MTLADRASEYAQQHPQTVRLRWITRKVTTSDAESAVDLCTDPLAAGNIVDALANDKTMEDMLNRLLDSE